MQRPSSNPFDEAAEAYDQTFSNSHIGRVQRQKVWKYLKKALPAGKLNVLEINCGTGEDALKLAELGHTVMATDISFEMIGVARKKVKNSQNHLALNFQVQDINALHLLENSLPYDLIFSNFGGLNCLSFEQLETLSKKIALLLNKSGRFITVVMPKYPFIEMLMLILRGDFDSVHRKKKPLEVNVGSTKVKTWYYSPLRFYEAFKKDFRLVEQRPVGFFIPPSYMEAWVSEHPTLFKAMAFLEHNLAFSQWQAAFSDHFYIEMQRK